MDESKETQTIGCWLKQQREAKGISIEQVASSTKISIRNLTALEHEDFSNLPARPFIRGFVSAYSRVIGTPTKTALEKFDNYWAEQDKQKPTEAHQTFVFDRKESESSQSLVLVSLMGVLTIGGGLLVLMKSNLSSKKISHASRLIASEKARPSPSPSLLASTPLPQTVPTPTPSPIALAPRPLENRLSGWSEKPGQVSGDPLDSGFLLLASQIRHKFIFRLTEDSWVRYQVDKRPLRKFVIRKGRSLVLRAESGGIIQFSSAENINVQSPAKGTSPWNQLADQILIKGTMTQVFGEDAELRKEWIKKEAALPQTLPELPPT